MPPGRWPRERAATRRPAGGGGEQAGERRREPCAGVGSDAIPRRGQIQRRTENLDHVLFHEIREEVLRAGQVVDTNSPHRQELNPLVVTAPPAPQRHGAAHVSKDFVVDHGEVNPRTVGERAALPIRDDGERQHVADGGHHARPRSESARRSKYTMWPLRLLSSSLAHSLSDACRSVGNRRKNFTTASAMTRVYVTLLLPCSHYSKVLLLGNHISGTSKLLGVISGN